MNNKVSRKNKMAFTLFTFLVVIVFQSCAPLGGDNNDTSQVQRTTASDPVAANHTLKVDDSSGYVCSAFGTTMVPSDKSGLRAELRFLDQGANLTVAQKNSFLATEYFNDKNTNFIKKTESIFLNDINVPTRIFNQGFLGSDGQVLKDNNGHALIEYFGLRIESVLKLSSTDAVGFYELSSIADDGSVVQIKENDQWVTIVSNDGAHSTQMGCADRQVYLDRNTRLPIRVFYNQGPREHIANVLVWNYRAVGTVASSAVGTVESSAVGTAASSAAGVKTSSAVTSDPNIHKYCGQASSDMYWLSATSQANLWIKDIYSKGWKVVAATNFQLPDNEVNPCAYSTYDVAPVVSYESVTDGNKAITIESKDSTILTINLYLVHADGTKDLVLNKVMPEDVKHTFETGELLVDQKYKLDAVFQIPSKKVKVLKSYQLSFSAN